MDMLLFGIVVAVRENPTLFAWHLASFCLTAGSMLTLVNPLVLMWVIDRVRQSQLCSADLRSGCDFPQFRAAAHPVELWRLFDAAGLTTNSNFHSNGGP
jgi:hypothetical protein